MNGVTASQSTQPCRMVDAGRPPLRGRVWTWARSDWFTAAGRVSIFPLLFSFLFGPGLSGAPRSCLASELPGLENAAARLQAATVTVRVVPEAPSSRPRPGAAGDGRHEELADRPGARWGQVSVCSGVSIGQGLIVSQLEVGGGDGVRITLVDGQQVDAQLSVVDHYSGLVLLATTRQDLPAVPLADRPPAVGSWVLSAAAWGAEKPAVSAGLVGSSERTLPGGQFPGLLQCDLRTAATSSGAGVVDPTGRLVGVVLATDAAGDQHGWTYAVPASHVQRLLRARVDQRVVVLQRRRPVVGLVLAAGEHPADVRVERVVPGGPADRAGIRVGDRILAADEVAIRSVYQALQPLLQKQPGDKLALLVKRDGEPRRVEVTLGGGIEVPVADTRWPQRLQPRRIEISRTAPDRFDVTPPTAAVRNLAAGDTAPQPAAVARDPVALLEEAVERYGVVIQRLQERLESREKQLEENQQQLRRLEAELEALRQQMPTSPAGPP